MTKVKAKDVCKVGEMAIGWHDAAVENPSFLDSFLKPCNSHKMCINTSMVVKVKISQSQLQQKQMIEL